MLKKLVCIGFCVMIVITLSACKKENKINEYDKEIKIATDNSEKSFDEILMTVYENKKEINDSSFFQTNSIHAEQPGGWGSGMGEQYYYSDDGYYLWNKSDYAYGEREVAKAGTWEIENGRLKLNELYTMYLEGGHLEDTIGYGGEVVKDFVDYKIVIKDSDKIIDMKIENKGLSDYAKDVCEETKDDTYLLNDNKLWFSGVTADITDMYWVDYYYTNEINKENDIESEIINLSYTEIIKNEIYEYNNSEKIGIDYSNYCSDLSLPFYDLQYKSIDCVEIDLNGDGKNEKIAAIDKIDEKSNLEYRSLYINNKKQDINYLIGVVALVDLDKNDKYIEILITTAPDSESFYRYENEKLTYIGGLAGTSFDENGNLLYINDYAIINTSPRLLSRYHTLENGTLKEKKIKYTTSEYIANTPMIFSENYEEIKKCIDDVNFVDSESKYFIEYREKAEILEKGSKFIVLDVIGNYTESIPLVRLNDGREGYIIDYDAHEEYIRRL